MTDIADDLGFKRDSELYRVISKHSVRSVKWAVVETEMAELRERIAKLFPSLPGPMRSIRFEQPASAPDADAVQKQREQERHAALFRAIRQSRQR